MPNKKEHQRKKMKNNLEEIKINVAFDLEKHKLYAVEVAAFEINLLNEIVLGEIKQRKKDGERYFTPIKGTPSMIACRVSEDFNIMYDILENGLEECFGLTLDTLDEIFTSNWNRLMEIVKKNGKNKD